ncbi:MAG: transporter [marine bacterium B5-7]|nr:MAG: transporter [marine bacterium B5-7]
MIEQIAAFHFLRPLWLLTIPLFVGIAWFYYRDRDPAQSLSESVAPHLLGALIVAPDHRRIVTPINAMLVLSIVMVLALSGPTWRQQPAPFADQQAAVMVLIKVTKSMQRDDVSPTRLERSQQKIHDLLALRTDAQTGLIAYAGSAHLVVPPTSDGRIVEQMAAALSPDIMPVEGDVLDQAIELARRQLEKQDLSGSIVIITDSVAASQQDHLQSNESLSAQFLAVTGNDEVYAKSGIETAARTLDASVERLSVDDSDVKKLNQRALSATADVSGDGERWQDFGYFLVPLIVLGMLVFAVPGFSVSWD